MAATEAEGQCRARLSALTAALFEETGRYLGIRFLAKAERSNRVAAFAGVGHGGIESIFLVGLSIVGSLTAYLMLTLGSGLPGVPPETLEKITAQYRDLTPGLTLMGGVERMLSLAVHFGLPFMVMQCFLRRRAYWLPVAIAFHAASNLAVVVTLKLGGAYAAEAAVAPFAVAAVFIAHRLAAQRPLASADTQ